MSQVKITQAPPVEAKHGVTLGRVFTRVDPPEDKDGTWVMGDVGEKVKLWGNEYEDYV